jgi:hypothetical protein
LARHLLTIGFMRDAPDDRFDHAVSDLAGAAPDAATAEPSRSCGRESPASDRSTVRTPRARERTADELVATGRTLAERVRPIVAYAFGSLRARFARR